MSYKKWLLISGVALVLFGCGNKESDEPSQGGKVEKVETEQTETVEEEPSEERVIEFNQVIEDNENLKMTLKEIEVADEGMYTVSDKERYPYVYIILFEVENKTSDELTFLPAEIVINDEVVRPDYTYASNSDINAGRKGIVDVKIENLENERPIPELKGALEMTIDVSASGDDDYYELPPVTFTADVDKEQ